MAGMCSEDPRGGMQFPMLLGRTSKVDSIPIITHVEPFPPHPANQKDTQRGEEKDATMQSMHPRLCRERLVPCFAALSRTLPRDGQWRAVSVAATHEQECGDRQTNPQEVTKNQRIYLVAPVAQHSSRWLSYRSTGPVERQNLEGSGLVLCIRRVPVLP